MGAFSLIVVINLLNRRHVSVLSSVGENVQNAVQMFLRLNDAWK